MALNFGSLTDGLATQSIEPDITEATPGEVQGANIAETFEHLPAVGILRQQQRYNEAGPETPWGGAVDKRNQGSDVDTMAAERGPAPVRNNIQPEEANKQAKEAGAQGLTFDKTIADTTAKSIIDEHVVSQQRAAVIARNGNSILSGQVARFGVSAMVSLADPTNDAAMLIPAAPEAFVGAKLAAASGVFERTMIRAAAGAANGAVGMAALEPLNYAMSRADYEDWNAGDALRNIFLGAAMGAAGHMALGGLFGREHLDHGTAMDATRAGVSQVLHDRPVDVAGIIEQTRPDTDFRGTLSLRHGSTEPKTEFTSEFSGTRYDDTGGVFGGSGLYLDNSGKWTNQKTSNDMRFDFNHAYNVEAPFKKAFVLTPDTAAELGHVIGKDLHTLEGADIVAALKEKGYDGLIVQGFDKHMDDMRASFEKHVDPETRAIPAGTFPEIDKAWWEPMHEENPAKGVRGPSSNYATEHMASHDGIGLSTEMRQDQVVHFDPTAVKIKGEADPHAPPSPVEAVPNIPNPARAAAAKDMAKRAMEPVPNPDVVRADRINKATIESAPKAVGDVAEDLAEATKLVQEAHQQLQAELQSGRLMETAEMRDAMLAADETERVGKAAAEYAACLVGKGF